MAALPEDAEATILGKLRGHTEGGAEPTPATEPPAAATTRRPATPAPAADAEPYGTTERQGIDQLIENNDGAGDAPRLTTRRDGAHDAERPAGLAAMLATMTTLPLRRRQAPRGVRRLRRLRPPGRRRAHRRSACTPSSTAARRRPASSPSTAAQFHTERHVGLVGDSFTERAVIDRLPGDRAIGHVRYSTHGGSVERNIQPLFAEFAGGGFAVAHNGNLTNALTLQDRLQRRGSIFQSTSDTEVILHLIATSRREPPGRPDHRRAVARSRAPARWSACRRRR